MVFGTTVSLLRQCHTFAIQFITGIMRVQSCGFAVGEVAVLRLRPELVLKEISLVNGRMLHCDVHTML